MEKIFNLSYSFRDEPEAPHHRPQFLMLEWYRRDEFYTKIMSDTQELFKFCINRFINDGIEVKRELRSFTPVKKTIQEIFKETLNIDILNYLDKDSLAKAIPFKGMKGTDILQRTRIKDALLRYYDSH